MSNTFLIADLHLDHEKVCTTFKKRDGSPLRPYASSQEMRMDMVDKWNSVVREHDTVYVLGDVAMSKKYQAFEWFRQVRGKKILVAGNHDYADTITYLTHFSRVVGIAELNGFVLTHVPIHPSSLDRWGVNIHGHLHEGIVRLPNGEPDNRYVCVSVEQTNFTPVSLETIKARLSQKMNLL